MDLVAEADFDRDAGFPRLTDEQLAVLAAAGTRRTAEHGEFLFRAGDVTQSFFAVLSGKVAIVDGDRLLGVHEAGRFVGELSLITGEPAYLGALVQERAELIELSRERLRQVIARDQRLGDLILSAYMARRALLIGLGHGIRLVGSSLSPDARRLREFLTRNRIPHTFVDLETDEQGEAMLEGLAIAPAETPIVVHGDGVLRNPTTLRLAEALRLRTSRSPDDVCDTIIVGAGPSGLGAAVYAASEGLKTVLVDQVATGGQAGTSSRIENYLGFPAGVSGSELAERAAVQAARFGTRIQVPESATELSLDEGFHRIGLSGGGHVRARTVVIATGATYRRLPIPDLTRFEGAGIYYAATAVEALACSGDAVVVVGAGNSAGQAAVFLAEHHCSVQMVVRGEGLQASMSRYLVDQVEATPAVEVHLRTEVAALDGDRVLERVTLVDRRSGVHRTIDAGGLFVFIGADPCTTWLAGQLAVDEDGFLQTGDEVQVTLLDPARDGRDRRALPLETSRPGVFAVGDVRAGSVKRVASAVGEGAMAVRLIHQHLASLQQA
jgi:thioredoxin reductase (NADPH)